MTTPTIDPPPVSLLILYAIVDRLLEIDGTGDYINDLAGNVSIGARQIPEPLPGATVRRAGEIKERVSSTQANKATEFTIEAAIPVDPEKPGEQIEGLHADIERALERPDDLNIYHPASGKNLLREDLQITASELNEAEASDGFETLSVTVVAQYPHRYGKPDVIT